MAGQERFTPRSFRFREVDVLEYQGLRPEEMKWEGAEQLCFVAAHAYGHQTERPDVITLEKILNRLALHLLLIER